MTVFHCDLDNTLLYSHKRRSFPDSCPVELYQGKYISYLSPQTAKLLKQLYQSTVLFVPTTTRTQAQYQRIDLGRVPSYALVANGSLLLRDGQVDENWSLQSKELLAPCLKDMEQGYALLESDPQRSTPVHWVEGFFLYCKSQDTASTVARLEPLVRDSQLVVYGHGSKVYLLPQALEKGEAVKRFREQVSRTLEIVAGDSIMDVSMLQEAVLQGQLGYCPRELSLPGCQVPDSEQLFSEFLLEEVLRQHPPE